MIESIPLNTNWKLTVVPHGEVRRAGFAPTAIAELTDCGYPTVPASVPGNFELDLLAAGLIDDPYYGTNTLAMQKLENRHLWYYTTFSRKETEDEKSESDICLEFGGIDTIADIIVNGTLIGHTENMLIPYTFPLKNLKQTGNELIVHIYPTVIEARKYATGPIHHALRYNLDTINIRKAGSMFGWDIMPRIVSGGLWKPVSLVYRDNACIEEAFLFTVRLNENRDRAKIAGYCKFHTDDDFLNGYKVIVEGSCGDSVFRQEISNPYAVNLHFGFDIENCKLWWPKNAGEPNLYDVTVTLVSPRGVCDVKKLKFGVRTVELVRTSTTDKDGNGEFLFKVNGKKIFVMGTNWVPLDAFPSQHIKQLPKALRLLEDVGCNMVRCWGGNVYENDEFYDFCDTHGIMIWQDFSMACGIYPQTERYQRLLEEEVTSVVKRLRNHACLALWSGDNECDAAYTWNEALCGLDPNDNLLTRKVIPEVLRIHDISRPYLPSSPYIDHEAFVTRKPTSEDHTWGPRDYFKGPYYANTVCHFASEVGYHGCPSPESLKKFIPPENLWPNMKDAYTPDDAWLVHAASMELDRNAPYAYRIKLMNDQVITLFREMAPTLEEYAKQSQISQAEAKKYFIERFRLTKWRRTGLIWWNLIDGWPQISDAVVDYYGVRKLAYHYIKRAQQPVCLMFDEPKDGNLALYGVNDTPSDTVVEYTVKRMSDNNVCAAGKAAVPADSSVKLTEISVEGVEHECYLMEWCDNRGTKGSNHYFTNLYQMSYETYTALADKAGLLTFEGF